MQDHEDFDKVQDQPTQSDSCDQNSYEQIRYSNDGSIENPSLMK